ncbi:MAG: protein-L-isoaspartate O-methyltransferase [Thermoprotei archaeon]|nr:MAG: protein-L-isoaspartate O-methyltransferase [Thermoprotei archaeon]
MVLMSRDKFKEMRKDLVKKLVYEGVIRTANVKKAMLTVPREYFVPLSYRDYAYEDHPLPIPAGQTISAPHMCAIMCEALDLKEGERLLEIGTGSGYNAALCAEIIFPSDKEREGLIVSVEIFKELAIFAKNNLRKAGYDDRIHVIVADGSMGAPVRISFDKILVTAAAPDVPAPLLNQLNNGGRMVIPIGSEFFQELYLVVRDIHGNIHRRSLGGCIFVKLRGKYGFTTS